MLIGVYHCFIMVIGCLPMDGVTATSERIHSTTHTPSSFDGSVVMPSSSWGLWSRSLASFEVLQSFLALLRDSNLFTLRSQEDQEKRFSLSCWALINASLNKLASAGGISTVSSENDKQLTFTVGESNGKGLCFWLTLANICRHVPNPASVAANVGGKLHVGCHCYRSAYARFCVSQVQRTVVVSADLESLVSSHDQSSFAILLVLE
jgi:hypothetical protein